MQSRMRFTCQMGRAEDTVGLALEVVVTGGEVDALGTLVDVRTPFGRSAEEAVGLCPPGNVDTLTPRTL